MFANSKTLRILISTNGFIVSNDSGTSSTNYGEFGINSSGYTGSGGFYTPGSVYLTAASTDLAIGTAGLNSIHFVVNSSATDAMTIDAAGAITAAVVITSPVIGTTRDISVPTTIPSNARTLSYDVSQILVGGSLFIPVSSVYKIAIF